MCGIFGITNTKKSAYLTQLGLFALQHRGQESAGIASSDNGKKINLYTAMGLVSEVFNENIIDTLKGRNAIGHVRYSTTGQSIAQNSQPLLFDLQHGSVAICHNGNLTNYNCLHNQLTKQGAIFQTTIDSEIAAHLMAREKGSIETVISKSINKLCGAYSFLFMTENKLIGVRDPLGFRPLVLGKLRKSYILASETSAIKIIGAQIIRDIEPGEMVVIEGNKVKSFFPFKKEKKTACCIFEEIYLARPDSVVMNKNVSSYRFEMGKYLAKESAGLKADFVVPVLDSGIFAALGFANESKIPFNMGMVRNHYMGRSFIKSTQAERELAVRLKLAPITDNIKGKDIVLIDDSIVRGTTSMHLVKALRKAGVKKIHMRVSSPPIIASCFYGIDTPKKEKLIANKMSIESIRKSMGVDSLHYLTLENLLKSCNGTNKHSFCTACFTDNYPTKIPGEFK